MPWPETALAATTSSVAAGVVELHCVHVPNAANGWVKVRTLEAIRSGLAGSPPVGRVLCGDLNTPRRELPSGEVISFARDSRGRLRPDRGTEWDDAELGVVPGLRDVGYEDAFEPCTAMRPRAELDMAAHSRPSRGWRLDHLFASKELRPVAAVYHHDWRDRGSAITPLEVDLHEDPPPRVDRAHPPRGSRSARDRGRLARSGCLVATDETAQARR